MKTSSPLRTLLLAGSLLLQHSILCFQSHGAAGDVDLSFDPGSGVNGTVNVVAIQSDGKAIIAGDFTTVRGLARSGIARLNADGSGDSSFNPGGSYAWVSAMALQPDGKVLVEHDYGIERLNADGSVDGQSIASYGMFYGPGEYYDGFLGSIIVQPDGKLIIGGDFNMVNGTTVPQGIARLNADGSLDTHFNEVLSSDYLSVQIYPLAVQADGKILLAGSLSTVGGTNVSYGIVRLHSNGSLDNSFNSSLGGNYGAVNSAVVQSDGKVLIGGDFTVVDGTSRNRIARLNADGSLDSSFNPGTGANAAVSDLALQADGKVLIGGSFTTVNGTTHNSIARLDANGSLDAGFNPSVAPSYFSAANVLALQSDGKVLIGGSGTDRIRMARLNADGSLDGSFLPGKSLEYPASHLALQQDGKVVLDGRVRLNVDGSADSSYVPVPPPTFNPDIAVAGKDYTVAECSAVQADGKVLVGGWTAKVADIDDFNNYYWSFGYFVSRVHADGSRDTTFNPLVGGDFGAQGVGPDNPQGARYAWSPTVRALVVQPDGKVLVGATFGITRLNVNGTVDSSFTPGFGGSVYSLLLQPDGRVLVASSAGVAWLNSNGSRDPGFNPTINISFFHRVVVVLLPDGKVLVGGSFTMVNGVSRNNIARLNSNGSLDTSFNPGTGADGVVHSIVVQPDGKVLVGGEFLAVNGVVRPYVARLFGDALPPPVSFATWAASFGLSGVADADPDHDGLASVLEYILGGNPAQPSPSTPRPTVSLTGGTMHFTFPRLDASETPDVILTVESGTDLVTWPDVFTIGSNAAASSPGVTILENGTAPDTITVAIPAGSGNARFARLRATIAP